MGNSILFFSAGMLILAVLYAAEPNIGLGFAMVVFFGLLINRAAYFSLYKQEV